MKLHHTCPKCKKEVEMIAKNIIDNVDDEEGDLIYELHCPHCGNNFKIIVDND